MTPSEYLTTVTPSAKRSKLAPHMEAISTLRNAGCSLRQICEYLEKIDVNMNPSGLAKFIKKTAGTPARPTLPPTSMRSRPEPSETATPSSASTKQQNTEATREAEAETDGFKTVQQLKVEHPRMPAVQLSRMYAAQFDKPKKNRFL